VLWCLVFFLGGGLLCFGLLFFGWGLGWLFCVVFGCWLLFGGGVVWLFGVGCVVVFFFFCGCGFFFFFFFFVGCFFFFFFFVGRMRLKENPSPWSLSKNFFLIS